ncbi:hypothetical protein IE53DRAFT_396728 [Violaceomyces palustris]|uniref:Uncharacterized protein n=1 Tax=Violaceomyces palustris TaxID=1673888 RepID=A0ACD0NVK6_9BASI|nr:hypothetical protein IE53DRAFT_396728 [Violaceomyces palustris]
MNPLSPSRSSPPKALHVFVFVSLFKGPSFYPLSSSACRRPTSILSQGSLCPFVPSPFGSESSPNFLKHSDPSSLDDSSLETRRDSEEATMRLDLSLLTVLLFFGLAGHLAKGVPMMFESLLKKGDSIIHSSTTVSEKVASALSKAPRGSHPEYHVIDVENDAFSKEGEIREMGFPSPSDVGKYEILDHLVWHPTRETEASADALRRYTKDPVGVSVVHNLQELRSRITKSWGRSSQIRSSQS